MPHDSRIWGRVYPKRTLFPKVDRNGSAFLQPDTAGAPGLKWWCRTRSGMSIVLEHAPALLQTTLASRRVTRAESCRQGHDAASIPPVCVAMHAQTYLQAIETIVVHEEHSIDVYLGMDFVEMMPPTKNSDVSNIWKSKNKPLQFFM